MLGCKKDGPLKPRHVQLLVTVLWNLYRNECLVLIVLQESLHAPQGLSLHWAKDVVSLYMQLSGFIADSKCTAVPLVLSSAKIGAKSH